MLTTVLGLIAAAAVWVWYVLRTPPEQAPEKRSR